MKLTHIDFITWLRQQGIDPESAVEDGEDECDDCDGSGICSCHCGDEHDCRNCDGTGSVEGAASGKAKNSSALKRQYESAIEADKKKWDEWKRTSRKIKEAV